MRQSISPGTIIDQYRVESLIGSGSMGDVYLAVDIRLNRQAAVKILSPKHRDNQELHARFTREGRAVAAISHPNVVQVFTTGTYDNRPYIAMEMLTGIDLGSYVKQHGPCTSEQAGQAVHDAARGLEAAAAAGVIHRDVKPSNLIKLDSGIVKVTDFGLAKPLDPGAEPALTAMGVVVGTPDYIAPEQARGDQLDERVDIYALGGSLYYLLTGMPPYRTGNPAEDKYLKVVSRHLRAPVPKISDRNSNAHPTLVSLSYRMMSKKKTQRPPYEEIATIAGQIAGCLPTTQPSGAFATAPQRPKPPESTEAMDMELLAKESKPGTIGTPVIIFLMLSILFFVTGLTLFLLR